MLTEAELPLRGEIGNPSLTGCDFDAKLGNTRPLRLAIELHLANAHRRKHDADLMRADGFLIGGHEPLEDLHAV